MTIFNLKNRFLESLRQRASRRSRNRLLRKRRGLLLESLENRALMAVDLNPGDVAVVGYNTGGAPDQIALVILRDLDEGTVFYVNDNEVSSAGGTGFTDLNEMEASFTVKAGQTVTAGTVVVLPWGGQPLIPLHTLGAPQPEPDSVTTTRSCISTRPLQSPRKLRLSLSTLQK